MSVGMFAVTQGGIAVCEDSRTLHHRVSPTDGTLLGTTVGSDNTRKLFLLWDNVTVATFGRMNLPGGSVEDHLFRIEASHPRPNTVEGAATEILEYFAGLHIGGHLVLWVAGYDGQVPFVFALVPGERRLARMAVDDNGRPIVTVVWVGGRPDVEERLLTDLVRATPPGDMLLSVYTAADYCRRTLETLTERVQRHEGVAHIGGLIHALVVTPSGARWLTP